MTWCSFNPKLRVYDMVLGSGHTKLQECDIDKEQEKMMNCASCEESGTSSNGEGLSTLFFGLVEPPPALCHSPFCISHIFVLV